MNRDIMKGSGFGIATYLVFECLVYRISARHAGPVEQGTDLGNVYKAAWLCNDLGIEEHDIKHLLSMMLVKGRMT
jgi:hypothetical protein